MSSTYDVVITTRQSGKHAEYSGQMNGRIETFDDSLEVADEIDGGQFSGAVEGGVDRYRMHGELTEFSLSGPAMVLVDGVSMRAQDMVGLGYAGPNPPQGYAGPGSAAWGGTGAPDTRGDAPAEDERPTHDSGGDSGGGSGSDWSGVSASMDQRIELAAGRDGPEDVTVLDSAQELKDALEGIPDNYERNYRYVMRDGTHGGVSAIQTTLRPARPEYNVVVVGNPENPWSCQVRANFNIISDAKDEHVRFEGMGWGRTQLVGPHFCRNMGFRDHVKGHSATGGKPSGGRYINSDIGKPGDPDRYGMCLFGGGECHIDGGTVVRGSQAAVSIRNTATVHVSDRATLDAPEGVTGGFGGRTFVAGREI